MKKFILVVTPAVFISLTFLTRIYDVPTETKSYGLPTPFNYPNMGQLNIPSIIIDVIFAFLLSLIFYFIDKLLSKIIKRNIIRWTVFSALLVIFSLFFFAPKYSGEGYDFSEMTKTHCECIGFKVSYDRNKAKPIAVCYGYLHHCETTAITVGTFF